jgi:hypothetical protein
MTMASATGPTTTRDWQPRVSARILSRAGSCSMGSIEPPWPEDPEQGDMTC